MLSILKGPNTEKESYYCRAALSDLIVMFNYAKSILKESRTIKKNISAQNKERGAFSKKFPEHNSEYLPKLDEGKVKKSIKKIEFYLSYIESCDNHF